MERMRGYAKCSFLTNTSFFNSQSQRSALLVIAWTLIGLKKRCVCILHALLLNWSNPIHIYLFFKQNCFTDNQDSFIISTLYLLKKPQDPEEYFYQQDLKPRAPVLGLV